MSKIDAPANLKQARLNALFELGEWQKLLIHFDLAPDSFAFIPVIVPDSSWAELCREALAGSLLDTEKKQLQVIQLETPDELKNLASTIFDIKPKKKTGAVWISAPIPFHKAELEEWQAAWREGMARLNQYRNPLREKFDVPVLLVGAEWIKEIARNMAPDLWSVQTTMVRIDPPAISTDDTLKTEAAPAASQFAGWRGVDPYFALREAERLRGKPGSELVLARLLYRASNGFYARAKYREALQYSTEAAEITQRLLSESNEEGNFETLSFFANILIARSDSLDSLGKLNEAIGEYDKAIRIYERLVNEESHIELDNYLATAYMNKGVSLYTQDKLSKAIGEYDKAIRIYERLVNEESHIELDNYLAMAYMNKGVAFYSQGKFSDAIAEYDKAIQIRERLVNEENYTELADDLALAYMNKGGVLHNQGKLSEAIAEYDKAIQIRERLVNEENRIELANDLAVAYFNKGSALKDISNSEGAVKFYDKGIEQWNECLARDEIHVLPKFLKGLRIRIRVLIELEDWEKTADDIVKAFDIEKYQQNFELSEHFAGLIANEQNEIIKLISKIPVKNRKQIYKYAGEFSGEIKKLVEEFKKTQKKS